MGRPYSDKFIQLVVDRKANGNHSEGTRLAELSIEANLPAAYIASMLNVSRMSVYSWFRDGKRIRKSNLAEVKSLIEKLEKDLASGMLPAKNLAEAASYASYRQSNVMVEDNPPSQGVLFEVETTSQASDNVNAA